MKKLIVELILLCAGMIWISGCEDLGDPASPDGGAVGVNYASQIQPIFNAHCTACHSAPASPAFGDLDLTSYTGLMDTVGLHAPVIIAGDPDGSYLVKRIEGTITPLMPLGGSPLSTAQIALIRQWISEGAQAVSGGNSETGPVSFTQEILPILLTRCASCHSQPDPPKDLVLTDYAALMAGGENIVVVPYKSNESELVEKISPGVDERMPLNGPYLTQGQIDKIAQWIDEGATNN